MYICIIKSFDMRKKKIVIRVLLALIILIAVAAIVCLLVLPKWKGIYLAGCGGFLIINLLLMLYFVNRNFKF